MATQTLEDQDGDLEGHSLTHGQLMELSLWWTVAYNMCTTCIHTDDSERPIIS